MAKSPATAEQLRITNSGIEQNARIEHPATPLLQAEATALFDLLYKLPLKSTDQKYAFQVCEREINTLRFALQGGFLPQSEVTARINWLLQEVIPESGSTTWYANLYLVVKRDAPEYKSLVGGEWLAYIQDITDIFYRATELVIYYRYSTDGAALRMLDQIVHEAIGITEATALGEKSLLELLADPDPANEVIDSADEDDFKSIDDQTGTLAVSTVHSAVAAEGGPTQDDQDDDAYYDIALQPLLISFTRLALEAWEKFPRLIRALRPIHNVIMQAYEELLLKPYEYADLVEEFFLYFSETEFLTNREKLSAARRLAAVLSDEEVFSLIKTSGMLLVLAETRQFNHASDLLSDPQLILEIFEDYVPLGKLIAASLLHGRDHITWPMMIALAQRRAQTVLLDEETGEASVTSLSTLLQQLYEQYLQAVKLLTSQGVRINRNTQPDFAAVVAIGLADPELSNLIECIQHKGANTWMLEIIEQRIKVVLQSISQFDSSTSLIPQQFRTILEVLLRLRLAQTKSKKTK